MVERPWSARSARLADRPLPERLLDALRSADPDGGRTLTSVRCLVAALLAAALAGPVVLLADARYELLTLAVGLAIFVCLFLPPRNRGPHLARVGVVTATTASLAALSTGLVEILVFGTVILFGAWLNRWPEAGRPLGFLGFLACYFPIMSEAPPHRAALMMILAVIGVGAAAVTVQLLVPDRQAQTIRNLLAAYVADLERLLDAAVELERRGLGARRQHHMRAALVRVQELALQVVTTLDDDSGAAQPDGVRDLVLRSEALGDHLVWVLVTDVDLHGGKGDPNRAAELVRMRAVRGGAQDPAVLDAGLVPDLSRGDGPAEDLMGRLSAMIARLDDLRAAPRPSSPRTSRRSLQELRGAGRNWRRWLRPTPAPVAIRATVLQALVAGGLAILLGRLISDETWPWAAIGAYVVVTTTATRGAGVRKAADRIVGSAIGAVIGIGLAAVLDDVGALLWIAVTGLLVVATWVFRVNYVMMITLLTANIALLATAQGEVAMPTLLLRVGETAVGALIAAGVVSFVAPTRTRPVIDAAVVGVFDALDALLDGLETGRTGTLSPMVQVGLAVSALRAATDDFRTATVGPLAGEVRAARLLATALLVRVSALVTAQEVGEGDVTPALLARVRRHLDGVRTFVRDGGVPESDLETLPEAHSATDRVLRAIDDRLAGYATARGIDLRLEPGALAGGTTSRLK